MSYERLRPTFTFDADRIAQLRAIAPEAFADGAINWEVLRAALGDYIEDEGADTEHFGLFWPGKRAARRRASEPSRGTLIPVPGEGVNEETTRNIFIEADNLDALKLLQKAYAGRVKVIYIDPPYNTGNDFVYRDDFRESDEEYLHRTGQLNEQGQYLTTNTKTDGRFHSNWLNMMYPRLLLARTLLSEDGAIFISIDDNEVHNLRQILAEIFGDENFVATLIWQRSKKGDAKLIAQTHEYVHVFAKNKTAVISSGYWRQRKEGVDEVLAYYDEVRKQFAGNHVGIREAMMKWYNSLKEGDPRKQHKHYNWSDDRGLYFAADFAGPDDGRDSRPRYDIIHPVTGKPVKKPSTGWRWEEARTLEALSAVPPLIHFGPDETTIPCRRSYLFESVHEPFDSVFYRDGRAATSELEQFVGAGLMDFPKNTDVIKQFISLAGNSECIVLDFFAGSGTSAQAVMELNSEDDGNRRFILVQLAEPLNRHGFASIADVGRKRLNQYIDRAVSNGSSGDLGFKSFHFASSNYKSWVDYGGDDLAQLELQFTDYVIPLVDGWEAEHLLVEVILLQGFPLDSHIEALSTFTANAMQRVTSDFHAHSVYACFDATIADETVAALALGTEDVFVCLDSALTDKSKARLSDVCNLRTI